METSQELQQEITELEKQEETIKKLQAVLDDQDYKETLDILYQGLLTFVANYATSIPQLPAEELNRFVVSNCASLIMALESMGWTHESKKTSGLYVPPSSI